MDFLRSPDSSSRQNLSPSALSCEVVAPSVVTTMVAGAASGLGELPVLSGEDLRAVLLEAAASKQGDRGLAKATELLRARLLERLEPGFFAAEHGEAESQETTVHLVLQDPSDQPLGTGATQLSVPASGSASLSMGCVHCRRPVDLDVKLCPLRKFGQPDAAPAPFREQRQERHACVVVLTDSCETTFWQALVLGRCLVDVGSCKERVLLYGDSVPSHHIESLGEVWQVHPLSARQRQLTNFREKSRKSLVAQSDHGAHALARLLALELVEYTKVLVCEPGLVLQQSPDPLFDLACPAACLKGRVAGVVQGRALDATLLLLQPDATAFNRLCDDMGPDSCAWWPRTTTGTGRFRNFEEYTARFFSTFYDGHWASIPAAFAPVHINEGELLPAHRANFVLSRPRGATPPADGDGFWEARATAPWKRGDLPVAQADGLDAQKPSNGLFAGFRSLVRRMLTIAQPEKPEPPGRSATPLSLPPKQAPTQAGGQATASAPLLHGSGEQGKPGPLTRKTMSHSLGPVRETPQNFAALSGTAIGAAPCGKGKVLGTIKDTPQQPPASVGADAGAAPSARDKMSYLLGPVKGPPQQPPELSGAAVAAVLFGKDQVCCMPGPVKQTPQPPPASVGAAVCTAPSGREKMSYLLGPVKGTPQQPQAVSGVDVAAAPLGQDQAYCVLGIVKDTQQPPAVVGADAGTPSSGREKMSYMLGPVKGTPQQPPALSGAVVVAAPRGQDQAYCVPDTVKDTQQPPAVVGADAGTPSSGREKMSCLFGPVKGTPQQPPALSGAVVVAAPLGQNQVRCVLDPIKEAPQNPPASEGAVVGAAPSSGEKVSYMVGPAREALQQPIAPSDAAVGSVASGREETAALLAPVKEAPQQPPALEGAVVRAVPSGREKMSYLLGPVKEAPQQPPACLGTVGGTKVVFDNGVVTGAGIGEAEAHHGSCDDRADGECGLHPREGIPPAG